MAFGLLAGVASGLTGIAGDAASGGGGINPALASNDRTNISVAPVGVNLGAILQPYTENPLNGGFGLDTGTPFAVQGQALPRFVAPNTPAMRELSESRTLPFVLVGGGLLAVGVVALLMRR